MDRQARDSPELLPTTATSGSPSALHDGAQQTSKATVPTHGPGCKGRVLSHAHASAEGLHPWAESFPAGSEGKQ